MDINDGAQTGKWNLKGCFFPALLFLPTALRVSRLGDT